MSALGFTGRVPQSVQTAVPKTTIAMSSADQLSDTRPRVRETFLLSNFLLAFAVGCIDFVTVNKYGLFASSITNNAAILLSSLTDETNLERILFMGLSVLTFCLGVVFGDVILHRFRRRSTLLVATGLTALTASLMIAWFHRIFAVLPIVLAMPLINIYYERHLDEKGVVTVTSNALYIIVRGIVRQTWATDIQLALVNLVGFVAGCAASMIWIIAGKAEDVDDPVRFVLVLPTLAMLLVTLL